MKSGALLLLPLLITSVVCFPDTTDYDYDYYANGEVLPDENDEGTDDAEPPPVFRSTTQHLEVSVGQNASFPCQPRSETKHVMLFKKKAKGNQHEKIFFVGADRIFDDRRYLTTDGTEFVISNVRRRDAGTYACVYQTRPVVELEHTLEVLYPPTARAIQPHIRIRNGDSATLSCRTTGNPPPKTTWSIQGGELPSGATEEVGQSITLEDVDRHVEGEYVCTADNGVGNPASATISLQVEYPPEIRTEKETLRTGEGDTVELVCVVYARPSAEVIWTKEGHMVNRATTAEEHDGGHRHLLTISPVSERDYGDYSCTATNQFGEAQQDIRLTGKVKP